MRVLVCGGAGYIGTQFVRELLRETTHTVVIADSLLASRGSTAHLKDVVYNGQLIGSTGSGDRTATLEVGDVRDAAFMDGVFERHSPVDVVVHMCALIVVPESVSDPLEYYDNNVLGMVRMLQCMRRHGCDKLIFSSTAALFGTPKESGPIPPDAPTAPESPYGETKLVGEWILRDCARAYGIKSVCLRYFNACGAHGDGDIGETHEPETHLIPNILRVALADRINAHNAEHHPERPPVPDHVSVFGTDYSTPDGTCVRDYIHVRDIAAAHIAALGYLAALTEADRDTRYCSAFNLGTAHGYSVRQVIDAARRVTGHPIPVVEKERRPGDPPMLVASGEAAREALGWQPKFDSIDKIIESAWKFHSAHPFGFVE